MTRLPTRSSKAWETGAGPKKPCAMSCCTGGTSARPARDQPLAPAVGLEITLKAREPGMPVEIDRRLRVNLYLAVIGGQDEQRILQPPERGLVKQALHAGQKSVNLPLGLGRIGGGVMADGGKRVRRAAHA